MGVASERSSHVGFGRVAKSVSPGRGSFGDVRLLLTTCGLLGEGGGSADTI